jgi:hypothetical protein
LGDDLAGTAPEDHHTPTFTNAVTCACTKKGWPGIQPDLLRDEEVVGSNPATPTEIVQLSGLFADLRGQAVGRLTFV